MLDGFGVIHLLLHLWKLWCDIIYSFISPYYLQAENEYKIIQTR